MTGPLPGQSTAAAERSAHVSRGGPDAALTPWAAEAIRSGTARLPGQAADPIVAAVQADLAARSAVGLAKYGMGLDRNDLPPAAWVQHALEEAMDLSCYLRRLRDEVERMQAIIDAAAAWRAAAKAVDDALSYAADVAQGIKPGSKKSAHAAAVAAEEAALIARAAYDEAAATFHTQERDMSGWTPIAEAYRTGHWINARWPGSDGKLVEGRCHWSWDIPDGGWTTCPNSSPAGQVFPVDWRPTETGPRTDWIEAGKLVAE